MAHLIHSLGKLVLEYQAFGHAHTFSVGLLFACPPTDFVDLDSAANDLAGVVKGMLPNTVTITGWHSLNNLGERVLENAITPPLVGSHGTSGPDWRSNTLTFSGRGASGTGDTRNGSTRMVLHVYNAFPPSSTETRLPTTSDIALGQVANFLRTDTRIWSDFNANKATVNGYVTQQFNSHTQKREGA